MDLPVVLRLFEAFGKGPQHRPGEDVDRRMVQGEEQRTAATLVADERGGLGGGHRLGGAGPCY